jgi:excisionase family DNA binding protein
MASPFLDIKEAAEFLRVKPMTVYRWAYKKKIPSRKHGRRLVFLESELMSWSTSSVRGQDAPSLSRFQSVKQRLSSLKIKDIATHPSRSSQKKGDPDGSD